MDNLILWLNYQEQIMDLRPLQNCSRVANVYTPLEQNVAACVRSVSSLLPVHAGTRPPPPHILIEWMNEQDFLSSLSIYH